MRKFDPPLSLLEIADALQEHSNALAEAARLVVQATRVPVKSDAPVEPAPVQTQVRRKYTRRPKAAPDTVPVQAVAVALADAPAAPPPEPREALASPAVAVVSGAGVSPRRKILGKHDVAILAAVRGTPGLRMIDIARKCKISNTGCLPDPLARLVRDGYLTREGGWYRIGNNTLPAVREEEQEENDGQA